MTKKIITKPFDRYMTPPRQNLFFLPFIWAMCFVATRGYDLKIEKKRMKHLKPPFIVLANHMAFMDFIVTPLALFPHRANYISELEGFEFYGGNLYRQAGALGTRKFIDDMALIKNIQKVVKRGDIIVIYPEARYANVGTDTIIPNSVGKLCKMLNVPVVTLTMHGNYLRSPIWNTKVRKQARLKAEIQQLFTASELKNTSADIVNSKIRHALTYDEYKWQRDNKISITYPKRAEGLELVLYKCPVCGSEFKITSKGSNLICQSCKSQWKMNEYGEIISENSKNFRHIPDWYEWQRKKVIEEIKNGSYHFMGKVHIEALPNEYNFIDLGEGTLEHTSKGFSLTFKDYGETEEKNMFFPANTTFSIHTEYNYRNKGQCITLSTYDNTYFLFPMTDGFNATKLQFATEYLYEISFGQKNNIKKGGS